MRDETRSRSETIRSLDALFSLLSDRRRRYGITLLSERDPPVALTEVATAVAARENDTDPDGVSRPTADGVAAAFHHVHFPKLDEAGVVDYDRESNTVTAIDTEPLVSLLERSKNTE